MRHPRTLPPPYTVYDEYGAPVAWGDAPRGRQRLRILSQQLVTPPGPDAAAAIGDAIAWVAVALFVGYLAFQVIRAKIEGRL